MDDPLMGASSCQLSIQRKPNWKSMLMDTVIHAKPVQNIDAHCVLKVGYVLNGAEDSHCQIRIGP